MADKISNAELQQRFGYHTLTDEQRTAVETVRSRGMALAEQIVHHAPPSRETSLAITHLEDAMLWANKAISRGES